MMRRPKSTHPRIAARSVEYVFGPLKARKLLWPLMIRSSVQRWEPRI